MSASSRRSDGVTPSGLKTDLILGICIVVFGLLLHFWIIPSQVNDAGSFGLPPSLAPRALGWLMTVLGAVLVIQNLRKSEGDPLAGKVNLRDTFHLALCIAAVAVMLTVMQIVGEFFDTPYSGFWVGAPLGLIMFTLIHTRAPVWAYVFNAIAAPAVIYAGFWLGLQLPMP